MPTLHTPSNTSNQRMLTAGSRQGYIRLAKICNAVHFKHSSNLFKDQELTENVTAESITALG
jgi:hypothetical protein